MAIIIDEHDEIIDGGLCGVDRDGHGRCHGAGSTTSCLALQPRWAVIMALLHLDNYSTVG